MEKIVGIDNRPSTNINFVNTVLLLLLLHEAKTADGNKKNNVEHF